MSTKTQERRHKLRMDLIDAAERKIKADGLPSLTARALAKDVGCALGAIYNVFPDLDALVFAVNSRTLSLLDREIAQTVTAPSDEAKAQELMIGLALVYLEFARNNTNLWSCLFAAGPSSDSPVPDWHLDEMIRLVSRIVDGLKVISPGTHEDRLWSTARALFSAVHGIVLFGMEERFLAVPQDELEEQITLVVGAITRGMKRELPSGE